MNLMELHDARLRRTGLRGMLWASGSLAATVAVGVSLLTAPVQVVASGSVQKQADNSTRQIHTLQTQVDEQAKDIRDLRAIIRTCFAPSTMCSPAGEPMVATHTYTPTASTHDSPVTVRRVTERTTRVETKQQPMPAKTTPPKQDTPKADPVSDTVDNTTKQVTNTVDNLLGTVAKASAK